MNDTLFNSADFFMVRNALLPFKTYFEMDEHPNPSEALFDFYFNHSLFQEAIAIASPALHKSISPDKSSWEKVYPSVLKYFLRMISRVTPFGLFSSVGWGHFADISELKFSFSSLKKSVKPDMEWVQSFNQALYANLEVLKKLYVMANPAVIKDKSRFCLIKKQTSKTSKDLISINRTTFSEKALQLAKEPLLYSHLENQLFDHFSDFDKEKVSSCLLQMFHQEYLLSELSIRLDTPFKLEKLKEIFPLDLDPLIEAFNDYSEKGIVELQKLLHLLEPKETIPYPLHVDSFQWGNERKLNRCIQDDICRAATAMLLLNQKTRANNETSLEKYRKDFIEKYGPARLVPILDLLDNIKGLGVPLWNEPAGALSSSNWWEKSLTKQIPEEIIIDDLIHKLSKEAQKTAEKAPLSLEIYFDILANSEADIDEGKYTILINPIVASAQAGNTFGRFFSGFEDSPSKVESMRTFLQEEGSLLEGVAFVEASFVPESQRTANVAFFEKIREFQIQFHYHEPADNILKIDDIYVGSTLDRFFLYSKTLKKELHISLSTAINPSFAPTPLKLMLEICQSRFDPFSPNIWQGMENKFNQLPRVKFRNTILSPRRWYFDLSFFNLKAQDKLDQKAIEKMIAMAFQTLAVPELVYLIHFDHRLLLKWKNKDHLKLLSQHFIANKEITLFEHLQGKGNLPVTSEKGSHASEFVLPLMKKQIYKSKRIDPYYSTDAMPIQDRFATQWIYAKLFLPEENEPHFLKKILPSFVENDLIQKWFYVRYSEGKSHIRLRLLPKASNSLLTSLYDWAKDLLLQGEISDFSTHIYEREIERYGGIECIELAEDLFSADSNSSLYLQNISEQNPTSLPLFALSALAIIHYLIIFSEGDLKACTQLLSSSEEDKKLLSGSRDSLKVFSNLAHQLFVDKPSDIENPLLFHLDQAFSLLKEPIQIYNKRVLELENRWQIYDSILHMHCNRLMGIQHESEKKARVTAYYILKKMVHS